MPGRILNELMGHTVKRRSISDPLVSFLCATFGRAALRPETLNECVYWFTRQTYPYCEMVILNDAPGQKLVCEVPGVEIYNWPMKIPTLGDKMNLMVRLANGTICLPQDDDDISLPHRADQAVQELAQYEYWTPGAFWYAEGTKGLQPSGNTVGHNCSAYRRASFVGLYPSVTKAQDAIAHGRALDTLLVNPRRLTKLEPGSAELRQLSYVYRWGGNFSQLHLSAMADPDKCYDEAASGPAGTYRIEPVMQRDYAAEVAEQTKLV